MLHSRMKRVAEQYQHEMAKILAYDLQDPRLEFVSVTGVKISNDLREAIVFVSPLEDAPEKHQAVLEALEAAHGYVKRLLAARLALKRLPDPQFKLDTTGRDAFRLFHIMEEIREDSSSGETD